MLTVKEPTIVITPDMQREIDIMIAKYPEGKQKSALIPLLHFMQDHNDNWLPASVMDQVAGILGIKPVEVYEVATFYSMFNLKPVGRYLLEVCHTGPCMISGSDKIVDYLKSKLQIEVGGTTADGMFTLKTVECLGACGYAPMMQVGRYYHEHLTESGIDTLLEDFRNRKVQNN